MESRTRECVWLRLESPESIGGLFPDVIIRGGDHVDDDVFANLNIQKIQREWREIGSVNGPLKYVHLIGQRMFREMNLFQM